MRLLQVTFLALQATALVEAGFIKWTLHSSCYRDAAGADDPATADAIINAVETAKKWASNGETALRNSNIPLIGKNLKKVLENLLGTGDSYKEKLEIAREKFKLFKELEGPIGKDGPPDARYENSQAWRDLAGTDEHHKHFVISCRPDLTVVDPDNEDAGWTDNIRGVVEQGKSDLPTMLSQEAMPWTDIMKQPGVPLAVTRRIENPSQDQLRVVASVTFHPSFLNYLRQNNWGAWTDALFADNTRGDALQEYRLKGGRARPVDGLLTFSIVKTMFHEMFHLGPWGAMTDASFSGRAYGWLNNIEDKFTDNPDWFAMLAAAIELYENGFAGKKYVVTELGEVKRK
ncbi:hypothetical protein HYQ45_013583 [Verticillium longisporum]|uniref:Lysine-specific metallo-endopeptidase domain-containing protein n=1 Tax=Verticillium longisporum TaxID=100787 RepID=A0A8I2ZAC8_VERLO|nr:hypothetical protein HYQ44_012148 [Verticillium longisporum]KAG7124477.1 hypothetical protein HYQ45_013583 [Verticillium longisporum]KAG7151250.1 hypothetical protein HYQ46_012989 [Verticillium longisporum]